MAMPKKTSPDYDPIEDALSQGHQSGREEERRTRSRHVESARRGGERSGGATVRRSAEADRKRRAEKARDANAKSRANRAARHEEDIASARRGAYRSGAADAKKLSQTSGQAKNRAGTATGSGSTGSGLSAPNLNLSGGQFAGTIDRTTSARIIILATALSAIVVVVRDAQGAAPGKTTVSTGAGQTVTVPTHLRSLGGVFIAGTVALVVNEVNPEIGLLMGLGLGFVTLGSTDVFSRIGGGFFGKTTTLQPGPGGAGTVPPPDPNTDPIYRAALAAGWPANGTAAQKSAWLKAHPGVPVQQLKPIP